MPEKKNPLISIITVTLNSEKTINRTINSVFNQTYKNIEYIIIDGLSSDRTMKIVSEKAIEFRNINKSFIYFSEKDHGISSAFNKGINIAKGEFLLFLNSDDFLFHPDTIEKISSSLLNINQIYCGNIFVPERNTMVFSKVEKTRKEYEVLHPAAFIGKNVFIKVGEFDEFFKIAMDTDFFQRAKNLDIEFVYIDEVITVFSLNGISNVEIIRVLKENSVSRRKNTSTNVFKSLLYLAGGIRIIILQKLKKLKGKFHG